jgi:uncharacterized protein (DUF1501 family)
LQLNAATGLHPSMTGIRNLFNEGKVKLIQGVAYPSPNFSHFRATDIWNTASNSNEILDTGWAGRYLQSEFPGFPTGYPNTTMPDPPSLQIGSTMSLALQGTDQGVGIALQNPDTFYNIVSGGQGGVGQVPNSQAGRELTYLRTVQFQALQYATQIRNAALAASNLATYPTNNSLAEQLKIVARMIAGGLRTRVYIVSQGGYDTHASQVVSGATTTGSHANLLSALSAAVTAFQDDLQRLNVANRTVTMTYSEFGRRVASNGSIGTDHGTAAPVFMFGTRLAGGLLGTNPSLTNLDNGNLRMQYDFRQIYATILSQWFGVGATQLNSIMLRNFTALPLFGSLGTETSTPKKPVAFSLEQNYPNPFNPTTVINYQLPASNDVKIEVFDMLGRKISTLVNERKAAGAYQVNFNAANLSSGTYLYRLQAGSFVETKKMLLVK